MKPLRKSALSPAWRAFVRHCERVHYGALENVEFLVGEPAGSATTIKTIAFGSQKDNGAAVRFDEPNAVLDEKWRDVIALAASRPHLCIRRFEVARGVPLKLSIEEDVELTR